MITFDNIIAESNNFKTVVKTAKRFSRTNGTILITGPTGTGKSYVAEAIHNESPRKDKAFIKINCANLSPELLESELFGHERGAFTDAKVKKIGKFEAGDGGTVFFDEIGEIPLSLQAKLLRVLEDRSFERVGGLNTIHSDVRIIAATNKNLHKLIEENKFRSDLYYRINILPVTMLALSQRKECLERLAHVILEKYKLEHDRNDISGFSEEALALIKSYNWPGNIRQLQNVISKAVILTDDQIITEEFIHIDEDIKDTHYYGHKVDNICIEDVNKTLILEALKECLWIQKDAAKKLGVSPRVLNYKINKYGITHPRWRANK